MGATRWEAIVSEFDLEVPTWFKKITRYFDPDGNDYAIAIEIMEKAKREIF
jgi:hypothetical protein